MPAGLLSADKQAAQFHIECAVCNPTVALTTRRSTVELAAICSVLRWMSQFSKRLEPLRIGLAIQEASG